MISHYSGSETSDEVIYTEMPYIFYFRAPPFIAHHHDAFTKIKSSLRVKLNLNDMALSFPLESLVSSVA